MRILWYSNSPFAKTGYGTQTALLVERLLGDGHELAIANNYGIHGTILEWRADVPILPQGADVYSSDILPAHYHAWTRDRPGLLVTLYDVWPLKVDGIAGVVPNIASWVPIDHVPASPETLQWFGRTGALPVAMSEFGRDQLLAAGLTDVRYIPHAIDQKVFQPRETLADGSDFRKRLGIPDDAFLVVINAANKGRWPPRKGWAEMFAMLGQMMRAHQDVWVYVHTEKSTIYQGLDLELLARARSIPLERLRWADRYALAIGAITDVDLAAVYTAASRRGVMLMTSLGEGFGIPAAEAMACGLPVIVSNFSAQPEIVGDTGWLVDGQPWWDAEHGADFWLPFIDSGIAALEDAYEEGPHQDRSDRARARAAERYDIDMVYPSAWRPLIAEMEELATRRLTPAPVTRQQRRAAAKAKR